MFSLIFTASFYDCRKGRLDPPPGITPVPYDDIASTLNTGDIMLFSGVTNSGAVIKIFDGAQFSHVAIVNIASLDLLSLKLWLFLTGYKV